MSVANTDIVFYTASVMPTSDSTTGVGGAIETTLKSRPVFSTGQMSGAASVLGVASNGTSDGTKHVRITGRNAGGTIVTEDIAISATADLYTVGSTAFERVLKAQVLSSGTPTSGVGVITVRKSSAGTIVSTIAAAESAVQIVFYDSYAPPPTGTTIRYEKVYIKNNNATDDLSNCQIALTASTNSLIDFGFSAVSSSQTTSGATTRLDAPTSVSFFGDTAAHTITTLSGEVATAGSLAATEKRGIWLKETLTDASPSTKGTASFTITGTTI
jgi:hypothetical protein